MDTVDHPKELFRLINATEIDGESYEFNVDRGDPAPAVEEGEEIEREERSISTVEVTLGDLSDEERERAAAIETLNMHAEEVDNLSNAPMMLDAKYEAEDGTTYMCDSSRMGYQVITQESPKRGGFACIFPGRLVKTQP